MPSPFPGMDPWLEHPALWPDVHLSLIAAARDQLQPLLGRDFYAAVNERIFLEVPEASFYPDVSVIERQPGSSNTELATDRPLVVTVEEIERREPFVELRTARDHRVVTVIEVLSPSNKRSGAGREVLASDANLVEIDLLRAGEHTVAVPVDRLRSASYKVVVSRSANRRKRELYLVRLADRLPKVAVPLVEGRDVALDLGAALASVYERAAYDRRVDYATDPIPPLKADELAWARGIARSS